MSDSAIRAMYSAPLASVTPSTQQAGVPIPLEERQEVRGDVGDHVVLLDGDERHEPLGLGLEHLLEHRVLEDLLACQRQRPLEEGLEVGRGAELGAELGEEPGHLPGDRLAEELVAPTREQPVHGGPGHAGRARRVLHGGLADPDACDALERAREHALARLDGRRPLGH